MGRTIGGFSLKGNAAARPALCAEFQILISSVLHDSITPFFQNARIHSGLSPILP